MSPGAGREAVERVAREASGRLIALLARRGGDLIAAEDAVSDALVAALEQWPEQGVPDNPEAWLVTVARRSLSGQWRRREVRVRKAGALRVLETLRGEERAEREGGTWPDERLPLLFATAHPAIDAAIRAPLMLQVVLGLTAEEIGARMQVPAKTMGQRLWRAKRKIGEAGIPFAVPPAERLPERLDHVLDALYGLYGAGWIAPGGHDERTSEALWLAEVVAGELPDQPEALGLLALLLHAESRRPAARRDGVYVPLDAQDPADWDAPAWRRADAALRQAADHGVIGPFQLEASIQSALLHGHRRGQVDHHAILTLYDGLLGLAPTLGNQVGRIVHLAELHGPRDALHALDALPDARLHYQPYWAVRAELLRRLGEPTTHARDRAIALTRDPAVRAWLRARG